MKVRWNPCPGRDARKTSDTLAQAGKPVCGQPSGLAPEAVLLFVRHNLTVLPPLAARGTVARNIAQSQFEGAIAARGCEAAIGNTPITRSRSEEAPQ
jgi:hypothetical protein